MGEVELGNLLMDIDQRVVVLISHSILGSSRLSEPHREVDHDLRRSFALSRRCVLPISTRGHRLMLWLIILGCPASRYALCLGA
jgi:hypothetical protein